MSMDRCQQCSAPIDTDHDLDCYPGPYCERCREAELVLQYQAAEAAQEQE